MSPSTHSLATNGDPAGVSELEHLGDIRVRDTAGELHFLAQQLAKARVRRRARAGEAQCDETLRRRRLLPSEPHAAGVVLPNEDHELVPIDPTRPGPGGNLALAGLVHRLAVCDGAHRPQGI